MTLKIKPKKEKQINSIIINGWKQTNINNKMYNGQLPGLHKLNVTILVAIIYVQYIKLTYVIELKKKRSTQRF